MAKCDNCTGTHYLNDVPDFGPCTCCTPSEMQKRDRTIEALTAPKSLDELLDELEGLASDVRNAYAEAQRERDEAAGENDAMRVALVTYLATQEVGANPVTLPAGDPLRPLLEAAGLL